MIATTDSRPTRPRATVHSTQSDLGESVELTNPHDSNESNDADEVSEYHPSSSENSAGNQPSESECSVEDDLVYYWRERGWCKDLA